MPVHHTEPCWSSQVLDATRLLRLACLYDMCRHQEEDTGKVQGTHTLDAPVEKVWTFLMDPQAIAKVIPGCETLNATAPDTYQATLKLGIAAIKGTYNGSVQLLDKMPPTHYRMRLDGSGTPGFVKGEA